MWLGTQPGAGSVSPRQGSPRHPPNQAGAAPAAGNAAARPVQGEQQDGWMDPQPQR